MLYFPFNTIEYNKYFVMTVYTDSELPDDRYHHDKFARLCNNL